MDIKKVKKFETTVYEIFIPIYNKYFYVLFGKNNYDKLRTHFSDLPFIDFETITGLTIYLNKQYKLLVFNNCSKKYQDTGVVVHEIIHLLLHLVDELGLIFDVKNQEPIAYLMGFLQENVNRVFEMERKKIKKSKKTKEYIPI